MAKGKRKAAAGDVATNRQESYRDHLMYRYEAGIQLQGSEVKSLRAGRVQLKDGYEALSPDGEVWLHNVHIPPYEAGSAAPPPDGELWLPSVHIAPYDPASRENHEPEGPRKLLLHRREIDRLI